MSISISTAGSGNAELGASDIEAGGGVGDADRVTTPYDGQDSQRSAAVVEGVSEETAVEDPHRRGSGDAESLAFDALMADSLAQASRVAQLQFKLRRKASIYRFVAFFAVMCGLAIVLYPMLFQTYSAYKFATIAEESNRKVAQWPYPEGEEALQRAREYNMRLAQSGSRNIGELNDPFSGAEHSNDVRQALGQLVGVAEAQHSNEGSTSEQDEEYMKTLDQGGGIIGSIEVPQISVKLPVYHGTSSQTLNSGAGHLYGTSFPVDQPGSHTVITAHRGLPTAMFFTRLGELKKGDEMYVTTMGRTFGYIVDRIQVIEPTDFSAMDIVEGEERLTLMTCTPYGINTHRLLVSGLRGDIPQPVSPIPDARRDLLWIPVCGVILLLASLLCAFIARRRRRAMRFMRARHAYWLPWW
jgi:sortase A